MSTAVRKPFLDRLADYAVQNGGVRRVTPRQARRLRKKAAPPVTAAVVPSVPPGHGRLYRVGW